MTNPSPQHQTSKIWSAQPDHALVSAVKQGHYDALKALMERHETFTLELASRLAFDDTVEVIRLSLLVPFDIWKNKSGIPDSFCSPGLPFSAYIKHIVLQKYMKGPQMDFELKDMLLDLIKERPQG